MYKYSAIIVNSKVRRAKFIILERGEIQRELAHTPEARKKHKVDLLIYVENIEAFAKFFTKEASGSSKQ